MRHASVNPEEMLLDSLQMHALRYLLDETDPSIGLVADSTMPGTVYSIAAVGMALASYPLAVEHGLITRSEVAARSLRLMRRLHNSLQSESVDATGYRGLFYHFLHRPHSRKLDVLATNTVAMTTPRLRRSALRGKSFGVTARSLRRKSRSAPRHPACSSCLMTNGRQPTRRSLLGGRRDVKIQLDEQRGRAVGSRITANGQILGLSLKVEEIAAQCEVPIIR